MKTNKNWMFLHTINKVNDNFIADFEHGVNHKDLNRHILLETIHLVHHNMFRKTNVSYPPDTHKYVWVSEGKINFEWSLSKQFTAIVIISSLLTFRRYFLIELDLKPEQYLYMTRVHSLSMYKKLSEKLTFLTPLIRTRARIRG